MRKIYISLFAALSLAILNSCGGGGGANPLSFLEEKEWQSAKIFVNDNIHGFSLNSKGDKAIIAWYKDEGSKTKLNYKIFNGSDWSSIKEGDEVNKISNPISIKAAINKDAKVAMSWIYKDSASNYKIRVLAKDSSNSFVQNYSNGTNAFLNNCVAVDNFNSYFGYSQYTGSDYKNMFKNYNFPSGTFGSVFTVMNMKLISYSNIIANDKYNLFAYVTKSSSNKYDFKTRVEEKGSGNFYYLTIDNMDGYIKNINTVSDKNSILLAIYSQKTGGVNYKTYIALYDENTHSWKREEIALLNGKDIKSAKISANGFDKKAMLAWIEKSGGTYYVKTAKVDASDGSLDNITTLYSSNSNISSLSVNSDNNGNVLVAWREKENNSLYNLYASYYNSQESEWSEAELIEDENENTLNPQTAFINGTATVFWKQRVGSEAKIYFNEYK